MNRSRWTQLCSLIAALTLSGMVHAHGGHDEHAGHIPPPAREPEQVQLRFKRPVSLPMRPVTTVISGMRNRAHRPKQATPR